MISYAPFWETLKRKQISQYQLIRDYSFSTGTLDTLRKNNSITMNTLHDICQMLQCNITDVVEFVEDKKEQDYPNISCNEFYYTTNFSLLQEKFS